MLQYVELTGKQYIDTGVRARSTGIKATVEVAWSSPGNADTTLLGAKNNASGGVVPLHCFCGQFLCGHQSSWYHFADSKVVFKSGVRCRISADLTKSGVASGVLNGEAVGEMTGRDDYDVGVDMYLGARNVKDSSPDCFSACRIYSCKIWQADANDGGKLRLVRDYQPCKKGGRAGLYDKVSGEIFHSAGSAEFVASEVEYPTDPDALIEWLGSDGNYQYIDTDVIGRGTTGCDMDFMFTYVPPASSADTAVLASRTGDIRYYLVYEYLRSFVYGYGALHQKLGFDDGTPTVETWKRYRVTSMLGPNRQEVALDGKSFTRTNGSAMPSDATNHDTGCTLWLFGMHYDAKPLFCPTQARVYSLRITQDGEIVRDFVPCVKGGEAGLYDRVSERIFLSARRDYPFTTIRQAGAITNVLADVSEIQPERWLKYIESDGEWDYLDTGVKGRVTTETELTMEWARLPDDGIALGSKKGDDRFLGYSYWVGGKAAHQMGYAGNILYAATDAIEKNVKYKIRTKLAVGAQQIDVCRLSDAGAWQQVATQSGANATSVDTDLNMYLCAMNKDGVASNRVAARIWRLKIWQDGRLVRDFRPVQCAGYAMLWDRVEKKLHMNKGKCQFVAGPDAGEFGEGGATLSVR